MAAPARRSRRRGCRGRSACVRVELGIARVDVEEEAVVRREAEARRPEQRMMQPRQAVDRPACRSTANSTAQQDHELEIDDEESRPGEERAAADLDRIVEVHEQLHARASRGSPNSPPMMLSQPMRWSREAQDVGEALDRERRERIDAAEAFGRARAWRPRPAPPASPNSASRPRTGSAMRGLLLLAREHFLVLEDRDRRQEADEQQERRQEQPDACRCRSHQSQKVGVIHAEATTAGSRGRGW